MKRNIINGLLFVLIMLLTAILISASNFVVNFYLIQKLGLPEGINFIFDFLIVSAITYVGLLTLSKRLGNKLVLSAVGAVLVVAIVLLGMGATIKFTIKLLPTYITWVSAMAAGYFFFVNQRNFKMPAILIVFPLLMAFGINDLWVHKIEYGNFYGEVESQVEISFNFTNKAGEIVNNESLKGKIVLFDFWYINCGPCWVKFPELQEMYKKYESNPLVEIYAVNRPMRRDGPEELFTSIEEKDYTFPVLKASQEDMDSFGVYVYPTVVLLNEKGEMVFMGKLEAAIPKMEALLETM
jgi:thiol-disulfide isomerase/thioredoxin